MNRLPKEMDLVRNVGEVDWLNWTLRARFDESSFKLCFFWAYHQASVKLSDQVYRLSRFCAYLANSTQYDLQLGKEGVNLPFLSHFEKDSHFAFIT
jgi:hypothetical protein